MSQFRITFKDATTAGVFVAVPQRNKEFIKLTGPAEVLITPENTRAEFQGYPELEEEEWSLGTIRLAVAAGGVSTVEVFELLRTTPPLEDPFAIQPAPTEHKVASKLLTDSADPYLHIFWEPVVKGPITFKSAVKITSTLAVEHYLALRLLARQNLRSF